MRTYNIVPDEEVRQASWIVLGLVVAGNMLQRSKVPSRDLSCAVLRAVSSPNTTALRCSEQDYSVFSASICNASAIELRY